MDIRCNPKTLQILIFLLLTIGLTDAWYYQSLPYRKPITINTSLTTPQTNLSLSIVIEKDSGMKDDYSDLRFTFLNGSQEEEIPYWIENYTADNATVWVKVPVLNRSVSLYTYYGNDSYTDASSPEDVFLFFDDFEGSSLNTSKWTTYGSVGSYDVSKGYLNLFSNWGGCCSGGCYYNALRTNDEFYLPVVVEITFKQDPYTPYSSCGKTGPAILYGNNAEVIVSTSTSNDGIAFRIGSTSLTMNGAFPAGMNREKILFNTSGITLETSWLASAIEVSGTVNEPGWIGIAGDTDASNIYDKIDWVIVRNYTPSYNVTIGQRELRPSAYVELVSPKNDSFVANPVSISIFTNASNMTGNLSVYGDDQLIYSANVTNESATNLSWSTNVGSHTIKAVLVVHDGNNVYNATDTAEIVVLSAGGGGGGGSSSVNYEKIARKVWEYENRTVDLTPVLDVVSEESDVLTSILSSESENITRSVSQIYQSVESINTKTEEISATTEFINSSIEQLLNTSISTSSDLKDFMKTNYMALNSELQTIKKNNKNLTAEIDSLSKEFQSLKKEQETTTVLALVSIGLNAFLLILLLLKLRVIRI